MPTDKLPRQVDIKISKAFRYRQYIRAIAAAGGFYVTNCQPHNIPPECQRFDCPMRALALPPEAKETDYLLPCEPPGFLADLLITFRQTEAA